MTTAGFLVEGMTCGRCLAKVLAKVRSVSGVTKVAMDLVAGGQSPLLVMSGTTLGTDAVRQAVESAGFGVSPRRGAEAHSPGDGPAAQEGDAQQDRHGKRFFKGGGRS